MSRLLTRLRSLAPEGRAAAALWLLHLALTSLLACLLDVWVDEAFSLHTTAGSAAYALKQALSFEQQPPVYFLLLWLWRQLSADPIWARFFSVACAALAVRLGAPLARRYARGVNPAWAVALLGFNTFVLYAAVEIRLYALALLFSALLLLLFHDAYLVDAPRPLARPLHALCAAAALGTQYFLGSLLLAGGLALLVLRRRAALVAYLGTMALLALCLAPLAIELPRQVQVHSGPVRAATSLLEGGLLVFRWAVRLIWPIEALGASGRAWIPRALLAALLLLLFRRLQKRLQMPIPAPQVALLCGVALMAISFVPIAMLLGPAQLKHRHLVALLIPCLLALLVLITGASRRERGGWIALTFVLYGWSIIDRYWSLSKGGDWRRVGAYLTAAAAPGQPILAFQASAALPLRIHYRGPNPIVALPEENRYDTFDVRRYAISSPEALARRIASAVGDPPRLWLVTDGECGWANQLDYRCDLLEAYVTQRYRVERQLRFDGTTVRLLDRSAQR